MKPYVLECAYEIVHKVGGVETVVRTKAPEMIRNYGQNFLMCGPYIPSDERYQTFFEDQRANAPEFNQLLTQFENDFGFPVGCVKYGQWLIPGAPRCVLLPVDIDCDSFRKLREIAVDIINIQLSLNCYDFKDSTPELCGNETVSKCKQMRTFILSSAVLHQLQSLIWSIWSKGIRCRVSSLVNHSNTLSSLSFFIFLNRFNNNHILPLLSLEDANSTIRYIRGFFRSNDHSTSFNEFHFNFYSSGEFLNKNVFRSQDLSVFESRFVDFSLENAVYNQIRFIWRRGSDLGQNYLSR
ncbi:Glycogen_synthase [Hexamita inflata]|uniref:Glycogen [starch] synthase n=1 Tax=Hexamita inflata TaxID=28002 RepID=A0AA86PN41_9EUKA|nr:Glycogen synthase [Hexamita inflata]